MKYFIITILVILSACTSKMTINKVTYNADLKKMKFEDFKVKTLVLDEVSVPYYKNHSQKNKANASWDKAGFKKELLHKLNNILDDEVIEIKIISPQQSVFPYTVFTFLKSKQIAAFYIENEGNFKAWMDIFFEEAYNEREEDKKEGLYIRQPQLDPNASFMLSFGNSGGYSINTVDAGYALDDKPFDDTGAYLYKEAPALYRKDEINKEKKDYLRKYVNTSGAKLDLVKLKEQFKTYLKTKGLHPNPPQYNDRFYNQFKALAGYDFPEELKALFTLHNGIENSDFLTPEKVIAEWKAWKKIYDDPNWTLEDLRGNNQADGVKTIGMYTNPYWIPFYDDIGGNFLAIDYAPGPYGSSGQIIAFGADAHKIKWVAKNMEDFLQQLTEE